MSPVSYSSAGSNRMQPTLIVRVFFCLHLNCYTPVIHVRAICVSIELPREPESPLLYTVTYHVDGVGAVTMPRCDCLGKLASFAPSGMLHKIQYWIRDEVRC